MRLVARIAVVAMPLIASFGSPALAQQDSLKQQYEDIKNSVGLGETRAPIDFTDRPPLVVPPTNDLPPPGSEASERLGVRDPDIEARRKALSDSRRPVPPTDPGAGATGLSARTYLIDPPSGMGDPAAVAASITHDRAGAPAAEPKARHARHRKPSHVARTPAPAEAQAAQ